MALSNTPTRGAAFFVRGDLVELPWETADRYEEAIMRAEVEDIERRP